jgi:hypothetical protein
MHDHRLGRRLACRLDQPDLRNRVHRDVGQRVALAAHVAGLRRQVEDHRSTLAQRAQVDLANVAARQLDRGTFQVGRVRAAAEKEAVQRGHLGAARGKRMAQIGAQESRPAGHQNLASVPVHQATSRCRNLPIAPRSRLSRGPKASPASHSAPALSTIAGPVGMST